MVQSLSNRRRGTVLVTALICMMFVMIMGAAVLSQTMSGLLLSRRVQRDTLAFNLSESGVDRALRWLKDQASPPAANYAFDPLGGTQSMAGGTYSVSVIPDPNSSGAVLKKYRIVGTGISGDQTEKVELVVRQSSFGKYAYFTDKETSSISGGRIWFYSGDRIRGPVHSNNRLGSDFQINWTAGSPNPIFDDLVTSVADDITYAPADPPLRHNSRPSSRRTAAATNWESLKFHFRRPPTFKRLPPGDRTAPIPPRPVSTLPQEAVSTSRETLRFRCWWMLRATSNSRSCRAPTPRPSPSTSQTTASRSR